MGVNVAWARTNTGAIGSIIILGAAPARGFVTLVNYSKDTYFLLKIYLHYMLSGTG